MTDEQFLAKLALAGHTDIRLSEKPGSIGVEFSVEKNGRSSWMRNAIRFHPGKDNREIALRHLLEWAA